MKVRGPNGEVRDVSEAEANHLMLTVGGWETVDGSDSTLAEDARALGGSALSGLTGGASDYVLAGSMGAPYQDVDGQWYSGGQRIAGPDAAGALDQSARIKQERENAPVLSAVGNIAGFALGPGKVLKGVGLAGEGLKVATAAGLVEGSIYGLSSAISEDALGDKEALSEKLLANVGLNAVAGGAGSALGFGLTRGAGALSKKLSNVDLKLDLDKLKTLSRNVRGGEYQAAAEKAGLEWAAVDDFAKKEGIFTARSTPESVVSLAEASGNRARADIAKSVEMLDGSFNAQDAATKLTKDAEELLRSFSPSVQREARAAGRFAEEVASEARGPLSWDQWLEASTSMLASTKASERRAGKSLLSAGLEQIARTDAGLSESIASGAERLRMAQFLSSKARGGAGPSAADTVSAGVMGGIFGGPGGAVAGAGGSLVSGELRRRAPFLTAAALEELGPALPRAANGLAQRLSKILSTTPELLEQFRPVLSAAMAEGAPELLRTHVELASGENGAEYLAKLGLEHEQDPTLAQATAARAAVLDTLETQARDVDARLGRWADRMVGSASGPTPAPKPMATKDVLERVEQLRKFMSNPEGVALPPEMFADAPVTSVTMLGQATKAAQFLLSKAPQNPYEHLPENMRPRWVPSPEQVASFNAAAMGVEDPLGALERAQHGFVRPETLQAIAATYPRLWEEARQKLFERAAQKPLSTQRRLALQPILGDVLGNDPAQAVVLMQMHMKSKQSAQPPGTGPDGRQVVSTTQNIQTQATRMEARGLQ